MAKIDVSKIEGYAEMSAEDKLKALEAFDIPDPDYSGYVDKKLFDKTASELAEKKKELRDKLSEDEATKLKEKEEREELEEKYNKLLRESAVSKNKARLVALGYDEALADETAEAMADGNLEKVFPVQKTRYCNHTDFIFDTHSVCNLEAICRCLDGVSGFYSSTTHTGKGQRLGQGGIAMKILKPGKVEMRKFVCPYCGCTFVASKTEINTDTDLYVCPQDGCHYYAIGWEDANPTKNPRRTRTQMPKRLLPLHNSG